MSNKYEKESDLPINKYKIPVTSPNDVELACSGASINQAALIVDDKIISLMDIDHKKYNKNSIIPLNFLGINLLRNGLITPGKTFVILQTIDDASTPSLMIHDAQITTYQSLQSDNLTEDVEVATPGGIKKNKIIYYGGTVNLVEYTEHALN